MDLLARIDDLARREHEATVELVEALLHCDRLRTHLDAGYHSLFDLLVRRLSYSNAAAARRVAAVRCAQRSPLALELLRTRRTSLTVLAKVESALSSVDDRDAFLGSIANRSQAEVESLLAARRPVDRPRERVRRIAVRTPPARIAGVVPKKSAAEVIGTGGHGPRAQDRADAESAAKPSTAPTHRTACAALAEPETRVSLSFSVLASDFAAFEHVRAELAKRLPRGITLEEAFNALVRSYLERNTPRRTVKPRPVTHGSRHIPVAVRREVLARDGHRCTFVGPDGTRCTATRYLEIDHIVPFARGGTHDPTNLRVLCRAHNQRNAELAFGPPPRA